MMFEISVVVVSFIATGLVVWTAYKMNMLDWLLK